MPIYKPRVTRRLSPNEEAMLLHQQREERRKARLVQVREQERALARKMRDEVKIKREEEKKLLEEHLQSAVEASHRAELRELEERYLLRMRQMGQGHTDAQHISEEDNRLQELRLLLTAEQRWRAQDRHSAAMKELTANQLRAKEDKQRSLQSTKCALECERKRAQEMAAKPQSAPMLIMDLAVGKGHRVRLKEVEGYASTYYHIPTNTVQRAQTPELSGPNAHHMAETAMEQDERLIKHSAAVHHEHLEKARLRHKHAMARVKMEKDKVEMLKQLKTLEREDRTHRQKMLGAMPANMFQPVHRRVEMGSEQQRDMEQAFERLFVKTHGVHTHHVLSQIAESPSLPAEEQTHSEQSEETAPSHETTGDTCSSPTEPSLPEEQPPLQPPHMSPTPSPVKVPTANQQSFTELSISDMTSLTGVNTTSLLSGGQQELGEQGHGQTSRGVQGKQQGEAEESSPVWKEMPKPHFPARGDGMHRLIGMIRTQHQAWNERMATRERQPFLAPPPPPHTLTATPHSEEDTGSFRSSRLQPESLSVYTLSSSGQETTPSTLERSTASPPPPSTGEMPRYTMATLPTVSEAGEEEASLHPSFTTHPAGETSHTNRQVWVTPQSTPTPEPLSISVYSTTLEMSNCEEASANSDLLVPQLPPSFQSPQENPSPTATSLTLSDGGYTYPTSNSQSVVTHTSVSYPSVVHTSTVQYPNPYMLHSYQQSYIEAESAIKGNRVEEDSTARDQGSYNSVQQPTMYSSDQALEPTFSLQSEHILHPPSCENKPEPLEVTSSTYMSKERHQQLEPSQQSSDEGVSNTIGLPRTLTSTSQQVNVPPALPRLHSDQAMTYAEPLSITTLENSQSIDLSIGSDTRSSTVTSQSHTIIGITQNPMVRTTNLLHPLGSANQPSLDSAPLDRARVDEESDPLTSQPLLTPVVDPSAYTVMLEESTASETSALGVGTEPLSIVGSKCTETTVGNAAVDLCSVTPSDSSDSPQDNTIPTSTGETGNNTILKGDESKPLNHPPSAHSLQEAFLLRRQDFIRRSQSRVKQLKDGASQRQLQKTQQGGNSQSTPKQKKAAIHRHDQRAPSTYPGKGSIPQTPPFQGDNHPTRRRAVTFSSPVSRLQDTGMFSPPEIHKALSVKPPVLSSQKREKIKAREMKERNLRFYNRLPEVRRKHEEETRVKVYATNRERAKQYQEKIRAKANRRQKESRAVINLTKQKSHLT